MELYLDNFRGFEKQYIELNDVNFLVGENSTGKTTLLGLLSLFSESKYLWDIEFKNDYIDFGLFSEIASKSKRTVKNFIIGVKDDNNNSKQADRFDEVIIIYSEFDGFPVPSLISLRKSKLILTITFQNQRICISGKVSTGVPFDWVSPHLATDNLEFNKEIKPNTTFEGFNRSFGNPGNFFYFSHFEDHKFKKWKDAFQPPMNDIFDDFATPVREFKQVWIDPVRSKPKRIYEPQKLKYSPEGEHTPTLLRDILMNNTVKQNKAFIAAIQNFGKASGLFDQVKIDQYRKSKDSPFSLLFKLNGRELKISNIGYGISQVLPILTEVLYAPKGSTFLIQQPEVHLHPRSQAYFGEFVYNQLVEEKKKFVIETHSDYLIDRFRLQVRKRNGQVYKKTNILFFETDGQTNKITKISIDKNGDYVGEQPQKFREFFLKEEMDLLGL